MSVTLFLFSRFTYEIAPAFILIERTVLKKMREIIGFKDGDGIFCPGKYVLIIVTSKKLLLKYSMHYDNSYYRNVWGFIIIVLVYESSVQTLTNARFGSSLPISQFNARNDQ